MAHGGPRPGSGRPPKDAPGHKQQLIIYCTDEEKAAILDALGTRERAEALLAVIRGARTERISLGDAG